MGLVIASVDDFLAHPLVVLLIGTALTGLLVPAYSAHRRRREKALEIKVGLVTQITERVTEFVMAVQFAELGARGQTQEQFDAAYKEWEVAVSTIRAQLEAYFDDPELSADWTAFAERVTRFYALAAAGEGDYRTKEIDELLAAEGATADPAQPGGSWKALRDALLARQRVIAQRVLAAPDRVRLGA